MDQQEVAIVVAWWWSWWTVPGGHCVTNHRSTAVSSRSSFEIAESTNKRIATLFNLRTRIRIQLQSCGDQSRWLDIGCYPLPHRIGRMHSERGCFQRAVCTEHDQLNAIMYCTGSISRTSIHSYHNRTRWNCSCPGEQSPYKQAILAT